MEFEGLGSSLRCTTPQLATGRLAHTHLPTRLRHFCTYRGEGGRGFPPGRAALCTEEAGIRKIRQIPTEQPRAGDEYLTLSRHKKGSKLESFTVDWKKGQVTLLDHLRVSGALVLWTGKFGILK